MSRGAVDDRAERLEETHVQSALTEILWMPGSPMGTLIRRRSATN